MLSNNYCTNNLLASWQSFKQYWVEPATNILQYAVIVVTLIRNNWVAAGASLAVEEEVKAAAEKVGEPDFLLSPLIQHIVGWSPVLDLHQ